MALQHREKRYADSLDCLSIQYLCVATVQHVTVLQRGQQSDHNISTLQANAISTQIVLSNIHFFRVRDYTEQASPKTLLCCSPLLYLAYPCELCSGVSNCHTSEMNA